MRIKWFTDVEAPAGAQGCAGVRVLPPLLAPRGRMRRATCRFQPLELEQVIELWASVSSAVECTNGRYIYSLSKWDDMCRVCSTS